MSGKTSSTDTNILKKLLEKYLEDYPNVVSLLLFAIRLFGYGILTKVGLEWLCPYIGC